MAETYTITTVEDVALVSFTKASYSMEQIAVVFEEVAAKQINVDMISQTPPSGGTVNISFSVFGEDLGKVLELSKKFKEQYPAIKPLISIGNSKISIYSEAMKDASGVASRAITALAVAGVDLRMITTSEMDISLLVTSAEYDRALAAIRAAFAENEA